MSRAGRASAPLGPQHGLATRRAGARLRVGPSTVRAGRAVPFVRTIERGRLDGRVPTWRICGVHTAERPRRVGRPGAPDRRQTVAVRPVRAAPATARAWWRPDAR